jgi:hypothetical protein
MALEGVLLGKGGLHGVPFTCPNRNTAGDGGGPLCPCLTLLCPLESRVFVSPAAVDVALFGVTLVPTNTEGNSSSLFFRM